MWFVKNVLHVFDAFFLFSVEIAQHVVASNNQFFVCCRSFQRLKLSCILYIKYIFRNTKIDIRAQSFFGTLPVFRKNTGHPDKISVINALISTFTENFGVIGKSLQKYRFSVFYRYVEKIRDILTKFLQPSFKVLNLCKIPD